MKFCLITYGCKLNYSDSEIMKSLLLSAGFKRSDENQADFIIINTCAVVEKTERKILKQVAALKKTGKKVILTGCLPCVAFSSSVALAKEGAKQGSSDTTGKFFKLLADAILGVKNIDLIVKAVEEISKANRFILLDNKNIDKAKFLKQDTPTLQNISAITAISEGCLGNCSYCATKIARGKLNSFSIKNIIKEINLKLKLGFKEIQLTSQDLAIFGLDTKQHKLLLPQLLKEIEGLDYNFKLKLGMMNPGHTKIIFKDLLKILESDKFYKFLHVPLQSGSNSILKVMNRGYNINDFILLAEQFNQKFPNGILATDIIVGHPLETEEDFKKTVEIIKKIQPEVLHIFKFSKRKGTADYLLKDFPDRIKKDRSRILQNIFETYNLKRNKKFLKTKQKVLIIEKKYKNWLARTKDGRAVILKNGKLGEIREVKIVDCRWNYLIGN